MPSILKSAAGMVLALGLTMTGFSSDAHALKQPQFMMGAGGLPNGSSITDGLRTSSRLIELSVNMMSTPFTSSGQPAYATFAYNKGTGSFDYAETPVIDPANPGNTVGALAQSVCKGGVVGGGYLQAATSLNEAYVWTLKTGFLNLPNNLSYRSSARSVTKSCKKVVGDVQSADSSVRIPVAWINGIPVIRPVPADPVDGTYAFLGWNSASGRYETGSGISLSDENAPIVLWDNGAPVTVFEPSPFLTTCDGSVAFDSAKYVAAACVGTTTSVANLNVWSRDLPSSPIELAVTALPESPRSTGLAGTSMPTLVSYQLRNVSARTGMLTVNRRGPWNVLGNWEYFDMKTVLGYAGVDLTGFDVVWVKVIDPQGSVFVMDLVDGSGVHFPAAVDFKTALFGLMTPDINGDTLIDAADDAVLMSCYNQSVTIGGPCDASDLNRDGVVNKKDRDLLMLRMGS